MPKKQFMKPLRYLRHLVFFTNYLKLVDYIPDTVYSWNLVSLCHTTKKKKFSKSFIKTVIWTLVPDPFVFAKIQAQPLLENEIFKASCLCFICNVKLSKFVETNIQISLDSFLQRILWKLRRAYFISLFSLLLCYRNLYSFFCKLFDIIDDNW